MSYLIEQQIVGALLIDAASIEPIADMVTEEMFTNECLGAVYGEYRKAFDKGVTTSMEIVSNELKGRLPDDVVFDELRKCAAQSVTSATIESYADVLVREHKVGKLRNIIQTLDVSPSNVDETVNQLMNELESLQGGEKNEPKPLPEIVREYKDDYFRDTGIVRFDIGFRKMDELLGGIEGGDIVVIGARPAVGKSAFAAQVASHLASLGKKVGFFNLEMKEKQIYERFLSMQSGIGLMRIRRAVNFLYDEEERFNRANIELEKKEDIVVSTGRKSARQIRAECKRGKYDVIVIDYLQLMKPDKSYGGNRYAEVGEMSHAVKAIAMDFNIPVIVLTQLNRVPSGTKEPGMEDIRESGDIEQDASTIILLWNTDEKDTSKKGVRIAKQRQGKTGKFKMRFDGDNMKFREVADDDFEWSQTQEQETPFD